MATRERRDPTRMRAHPARSFGPSERTGDGQPGRVTDALPAPAFDLAQGHPDHRAVLPAPTPQPPGVQRSRKVHAEMIAHCVFLNLADDPRDTDLAEVMDALAALVGVIDGMTGFDHGPNRDFEGKSPDHRYGFIALFRDRAALMRYDRDPRHRALGARLVDLCAGGAGGIVVYDLDYGARAAAP